jgi:myo-inositol-1(or 4)-monophosphatase
MKYKKELDLLKEIVKPTYEDATLYAKDVAFKGVQDIVTSTDLYIEKHLIKKILETFPNDLFHSEEYHSKTTLDNRMWIIDPIDGTSNYAADLGLYVVQIALYDQDDIALSFVYVPKFNKTYYAIKGEGAYINDKPYKTTDKNQPSNFMISMCGLSHKKEDKSYFKKIIDLSITHKYKLRILGTMGLELTLSSEGVFDLFYSNVTNLWDLCPGILLVREAGAILLNEKGEPYQLGDENLFVCKDEQALQLVKTEILEE